jgi:uncharacterized membrane protein YuzA (DUF378 family)
MAKNVVDWIALILLIIGGLNWGLVAINPAWEVVTGLFGAGTIANIIYGLVGLSALYTIFYLFKD